MTEQEIAELEKLGKAGIAAAHNALSRLLEERRLLLEALLEQFCGNRMCDSRACAQTVRAINYAEAPAAPPQAQSSGAALRGEERSE